jgi:hypothetical protein
MMETPTSSHNRAVKRAHMPSSSDTEEDSQGDFGCIYQSVNTVYSLSQPSLFPLRTLVRGNLVFSKFRRLRYRPAANPVVSQLHWILLESF